MKKCLTFSFSFLLFFFQQAYSQTTQVKGVVLDKANGETLIGANITLGDKYAAQSDILGDFSMDAEPGTYQLKVSYVGYDDYETEIILKPGEPQNLSIKMKSSSKTFGPVIVSASLYKKELAKEVVTADVLGDEFLKNTNTRDLGEAVNKSPGVQVQDGQISIRGGSSYSYGVGSRTAVLVDGLTNMSADLGEAQLKLAPLENVEQVEVVKGASSVVYGSSALNGVVNVITDWPKKDENSSEVNAYATIFNNPRPRYNFTRTNDTTLSRVSNRWWLVQPNIGGITVNHKRNKGNFYYTVGGNIDNTQSFLESANEFRIRGSFKTKYHLKKNPNIFFGLNGIVLHETNQRFFISQDLDVNHYRVAEGSDDKYVRTIIDPHFTFDNGVHRVAVNLRYMNNWRNGNGADVNASSNSFTSDLQYQYFLKKMLVITAGIPVNFGRSVSNLYEGVRLNYSGAGYVQGEFSYKRISILGGVRYEILAVDTVFDTSIPVFRMGANMRVGKATHFRASLGQSYRLPTVGERFVSEEFTAGIFIVPNPELVAEKGWGLDVSIYQGLKIKDWVGYFLFSFFWQEYKQFVEYRFAGFPNDRAVKGDDSSPEFSSLNLYDKNTGGLLVKDFFESPEDPFGIGLNPVNVESARIAGYETTIAGEGEIGPVSVRTLFGYSYTWPSNREEDSTATPGDYMKDFFKYMFRRVAGDSYDEDENPELRKLLYFRNRHTIRGDIEFTYKKLSLGFTLIYGSFPERIPPIFQSALIVIGGNDAGDSFTKYLEDHQKGDWVMNARIAYKISEQWRMSFLVNNFTNKEYSTRPGRPEAPRSYTVQARFNF